MPVYKGSTLVNGVNVTIENVVSSGGITPAGTIDISSNGTYDVTEYASANVNVPEKEFTTQTKTAMPTESEQVISPDVDYDGLSSVTIAAIPSNYIGSSVPTKESGTITPGTTDQTIAAGQYLTGTQTISGDANLVAENIISGKSIFGVAGGVVIQTYYTGTDTPDSSLGNDGDLYLKTTT